MLTILVADRWYDINVSLDNREVFLKNEPKIIVALQIKLNK